MPDPMTRAESSPEAQRPGESLEGQRALFRAERSALALLEAMPGPAMVLNRSREVVLANRRLSDALEISELQLLAGPPPGQLLACRHATAPPRGCGTTPACEFCGANRAILDCLRSHGQATQECRILTQRQAGPGALDVRVHATSVEIGDEEFLIVALEDISSEKRRRVLERTFFHDLMNTCGGLQGLVELLVEPGIDAAFEADLKSDLRRLSTHVIDQIVSQRQLLAAERGELAVNAGPVHLERFLAETVALYRHHEVAEGRELALEVARPGTVHTDSALLGRVVGNLIKNALEATPAGGRVEVRCEHGPHDTTISVHNPGQIPREAQLQIFQRSFSTKGGEGRGVGTYSVRLFAEQYLHGHVRFESGEGTGTVFEVTLPNAFPMAQAA